MIMLTKCFSKLLFLSFYIGLILTELAFHKYLVHVMMTGSFCSQLPDAANTLVSFN